MSGQITYVSSFPISQEGLALVLKNDALTQQIGAEGPMLLVYTTLDEDPTSPSGFKWSSQKGPESEITNATLSTAFFVLREQSLISFFLKSEGEK